MKLKRKYRWVIRIWTPCWEKCKSKQTTLLNKIHKRCNISRKSKSNNNLSQAQTRKTENTHPNGSSNLPFKMIMTSKSSKDRYKPRADQETTTKKAPAEISKGNHEIDKRKLNNRRSTKNNRSCNFNNIRVVEPSNRVLEQATTIRIKFKWYIIRWRPKGTWTRHNNSILEVMRKRKGCRTLIIWPIHLKLAKDQQAWRMPTRCKFSRNNRFCCSNSRNNIILNIEAEATRPKTSSSSKWFHQVTLKENNRWDSPDQRLQWVQAKVFK